MGKLGRKKKTSLENRKGLTGFAKGIKEKKKGVGKKRKD